MPDLVRIVRGIVNLYERAQVRLFVRRDAFRRFYSCLVYVPRDRYNTQARERIEAVALDGIRADSRSSRRSAVGVRAGAAAHAGAHAAGLGRRRRRGASSSA